MASCPLQQLEYSFRECKGGGGCVGSFAELPGGEPITRGHAVFFCLSLCTRDRVETTFAPASLAGNGAVGSGGQLYMTSFNKHTLTRPACLYASSDSGTTWRVLAFLASKNSTSAAAGSHYGPFEASVAATSRGLYINGRHLDFTGSCAGGKNPRVPRVSGFSTDSGATFDLGVSSVPTLDDDCVGCHMALLARPTDNSRIYMSGPAGPAKHPGNSYDARANDGRRQLAWHRSSDGGSSWQTDLIGQPSDYAGYSSMAFLATTRAGIGLLYETNTASDTKQGCSGACSVVFRVLDEEAEAVP